MEIEKQKVNAVYGMCAKKKKGDIKTFEDMIKMVYAMNENVVYCDTDSIYQIKKERLEHGDRLEKNKSTI